MTRRVQRVAELLKRQISVMVKDLIKEELGMVTVTAVDVSADLKVAMVYISCFDKKCEKEIVKTLENHVQDFQHRLGRQLRMRYTPKITYKIDQSLEEVNRVEEILNKIQK